MKFTLSVFILFSAFAVPGYYMQSDSKKAESSNSMTSKLKRLLSGRYNSLRSLPNQKLTSKGDIKPEELFPQTLQLLGRNDVHRDMIDEMISKEKVQVLQKLADIHYNIQLKNQELFNISRIRKPNRMNSRKYDIIAKEKDELEIEKDRLVKAFNQAIEEKFKSPEDRITHEFSLEYPSNDIYIVKKNGDPMNFSKEGVFGPFTPNKFH